MCCSDRVSICTDEPVHGVHDFFFNSRSVRNNARHTGHRQKKINGG